MKWPWVLRSRAEAAEREATEAQKAAELAVAGAEARAQAAEDRLAAVEAERKLLTDRAFQMMGQPPVFAKPEMPAPSAAKKDEAAGPSLPGPKTRLGFDDIHEAFRSADRDGKINLLRRA